MGLRTELLGPMNWLPACAPPNQCSPPELLVITGLPGECPTGADHPMANRTLLLANMHTDLGVTSHPWTSKRDSYVHLKETLGLQGLLTKARSSSAGVTPTAAPLQTPWDPAVSLAWPLSSTLQERTGGETTCLNFFIWILDKWN